MSRDISAGEAVLNRDINVGAPILNLFPELKPILDNKKVSQAFNAIDTIARRRKSLFTWLGTLSLILVCAVLVVLSWRLSLKPVGIEFPSKLDILATGCGLIAVVIQASLFLSGLHKKWIYARYMAERMRLWKFQTLLDGQFISGVVSRSTEQFITELHQKWTVFNEEFKHGIGGMNEFVESQPPELIVEPTPYTDQSLLDKVRKAFIMLRLDVQISHYEAMNAQLEPWDKLTDGWSKVFLGLSGGLAVIEACLMTAHLVKGQAINSHNPTRTTAILAGTALSLAIISAGIRVYRGAAMLVEERERYHIKQTHLKRIKDRLLHEAGSHKILSLMEEAERVCSEELQDFIRVLRRADYFF